jgi:hypothetical protein
MRKVMKSLFCKIFDDRKQSGGLHLQVLLLGKESSAFDSKAESLLLRRDAMLQCSFAISHDTGFY